MRKGLGAPEEKIYQTKEGGCFLKHAIVESSLKPTSPTPLQETENIINVLQGRKPAQSDTCMIEVSRYSRTILGFQFSPAGFTALIIWKRFKFPSRYLKAEQNTLDQRKKNFKATNS